MPLGAVGDERALIAAERQALSQRFLQQELDCASRFVVNACIDDVRQRRRDALQPLRERELSLDEAERTRRAAERRSAIAAKQAAAATLPAAASAPPPQLRLRDNLPAAPPRPPRSSPARDQTDRAAEAAERVRDAERRRDEAQANQRRVQQREAERATSGRSSAPLPVPGAASAASAVAR